MRRLPVGVLQEESPFQGIIDSLCNGHESLATTLGCGNADRGTIVAVTCDVLNGLFSLLGCEAVEPPPIQECVTDEDCGEYEACISQQCQTVECKEDAQCDDHETCDNDYECKRRTCTEDGQCPDGVCISGYCEDCREDEDCAGNEQCDENACVPKYCTVDLDCPQPPESDYRHVCEGNACEPDPEDCRAFPGICSEPTPVCNEENGACAECVENEDCEEGRYVQKTPVSRESVTKMRIVKAPTYPPVARAITYAWNVPNSMMTGVMPRARFVTRRKMNAWIA